MCSPVGFDREPRCWRYERSTKRACEHARRKDSRQGFGKAREGPLIPCCLLDLPVGHTAAPRTSIVALRGKAFVHKGGNLWVQGGHGNHPKPNSYPKTAP